MLLIPPIALNTITLVAYWHNYFDRQKATKFYVIHLALYFVQDALTYSDNTSPNYDKSRNNVISTMEIINLRKTITKYYYVTDPPMGNPVLSQYVLT